jgi:hypothetical protein
MTEVKIGNKKYKLQFGYAVVAKGGIVKKLIELENLFDGEDVDFSSNLETIMGTLDELLLAALQRNHSDEFGYTVRTGNGHDEALQKVADLLDKYLDSEDADPMGLITILTEELQNNGFLHHLLRQINEAEKKTE